MEKSKKKKKVLTATLAFAMAAAIGINWYYNSGNLGTSSDTETTREQNNLGDSIYVNANTEGTKDEEKDNNENEEVTDVVKAEEYFAQAQLKRTQAHDTALDEIQKVLDNKGAGEEVQSLLDEYTNMIKLETDIENLITAKIDCKCLVIINSDKAEIVVESDAIDELYMLQITEIVSGQTDIPAENIIIIQAK